MEKSINRKGITAVCPDCNSPILSAFTFKTGSQILLCKPCDTLWEIKAKQKTHLTFTKVLSVLFLLLLSFSVGLIYGTKQKMSLVESQYKE